MAAFAGQVPLGSSKTNVFFDSNATSVGMDDTSQTRAQTRSSRSAESDPRFRLIPFEPDVLENAFEFFNGIPQWHACAELQISVAFGDRFSFTVNGSEDLPKEILHVVDQHWQRLPFEIYRSECCMGFVGVEFVSVPGMPEIIVPQVLQPSLFDFFLRVESGRLSTVIARRKDAQYENAYPSPYGENSVGVIMLLQSTPIIDKNSGLATPVSKVMRVMDQIIDKNIFQACVRTASTIRSEPPIVVAQPSGGLYGHQMSLDTQPDLNRTRTAPNRAAEKMLARKEMMRIYRRVQLEAQVADRFKTSERYSEAPEGTQPYPAPMPEETPQYQRSIENLHTFILMAMNVPETILSVAAGNVSATASSEQLTVFQASVNSLHARIRGALVTMFAHAHRDYVVTDTYRRLETHMGDDMDELSPLEITEIITSKVQTESVDIISRGFIMMPMETVRLLWTIGFLSPEQIQGILKRKFNIDTTPVSYVEYIHTVGSAQADLSVSTRDPEQHAQDFGLQQANRAVDPANTKRRSLAL